MGTKEDYFYWRVGFDKTINTSLWKLLIHFVFLYFLFISLYLKLVLCCIPLFDVVLLYVGVWREYLSVYVFVPVCM